KSEMPVHLDDCFPRDSHKVSGVGNHDSNREQLAESKELVSALVNLWTGRDGAIGRRRPHDSSLRSRRSLTNQILPDRRPSSRCREPYTRAARRSTEEIAQSFQEVTG